jgi:hypothetical protein
MNGVTTAIVLFIFACMVYPKLVKNKSQYYAAFGMVCAIILLDALGMVLRAPFSTFAYFMTALLQIGAILVLFLAAGGLSPRELGDEMLRAFEVIRRGEEEKEIIIPLTGQKPGQKPGAGDAGDDSHRQRVTLDDPSAPPAPKQTDSSLPLE